MRESDKGAWRKSSANNFSRKGLTPTGIPQKECLVLSVIVRCRSLHFIFDGLQFFACFGPLALGGEFTVAAQVVADAGDAWVEVSVGRWRGDWWR